MKKTDYPISEEVLFDVRLIERHTRIGKITQEALDSKNAQIADQEENSEIIPLEKLLPQHKNSVSKPA